MKDISPIQRLVTMTIGSSISPRCRKGTKHRLTSAYHPQTNSLDERTNHTVKRTIGKSLDGHQERWEDNLKVILFAHNSSVQASTKYSPYCLMYGREPRLSSEVCKLLILFFLFCLTYFAM